MSLLITSCVIGTAVTGLAAIRWGRVIGMFLSAVWAATLVYFVVPPVFSFEEPSAASLGILGAYGIVSVAIVQRLPRAQANRFRRSQDGGSSPYEVEYHLTSSGWFRGSEWFLGILQADVTPPGERLLTLVKRVCQRPGATAAQVTWSETWRDGSVQDEELTALRALHPLLLAPTEEAHHPVVVRTLPGRVRGFVSRIFGWDIEPYAGE